MYPTVKDVARHAGVSPSTVSRVIANHPRISQQTKRRVRAAMRELNYHPNAIARSLVRQRAQTIGVAMARSAEAALANPFFPEVLRGIGSVAQASKYSILLPAAGTHEDERRQCMELLRERRVDGIILLGSRADDPFIEELHAEGYPFVVIGRVETDGISYVNNDNVAAAFEATRHLIDLGHRRIAFIGGPSDLFVSQDRLRGYQEALAHAGIPLDPELVCETDFGYDKGVDAARSLMRHDAQLTAIVAVDDVLALAALQAAREAGRSVPDQLSVVGFNDTPVCLHVTPELTSVRIPIYDMGAAAARLLLASLAGESAATELTLPARLVVRGSTAERAGDPPQKGE